MNWAGPAGNAYFTRNPFDANLERQKKLLGHILGAPYFNSVVEYGCGDGINLSALADLFPNIKTFGVEINEGAAKQALSRGHEVMCSDVLHTLSPAELLLWCGTLIHISPEDIRRAYSITNAAAGNYVLMIEYFNPTPIEVPYREGLKLWKRDFGGEFMDLYPHWKLLDYGFAYKLDASLGNQDNVTWWLMERSRK